MALEEGDLGLVTPEVFLPLLVKGPKYKGARGGRGSGKSHFFAEYIIERCIDDPRTRVVCVREVQKSLRDSSKRLIEDKIEGLGVSRYFDTQESLIYVLDDDGNRAGVIIFTGMQNHTSSSIKSLEGYNIAWVEEAQSITSRSWELLYPTIRAQDGEIWCSWNPDTIDDPVEKFFYQSKNIETGVITKVNDPDIVCVTANYHDNPFFANTSLVNDMLRDQRRDPGKYAHIWLGEYRSMADAAVFTNWQVYDFETPKTVGRFYYGSDWGFSVDPSCLVRCWIGRLDHGRAVYTPTGKCLFVDYEAWELNCEMDDLPALFAGTCPIGWKDPKTGGPLWYNHQNRPGIPGALHWPITGDSARPETISYMQNRRFKIKPALKGPSSVEDGIEFLKNYDIYVHPRCVHVADELARYQYKLDPKTDEVLPVLDDKNNHTIDSLRYAVEGIRRAGVFQINRAAIRAV